MSVQSITLTIDDKTSLVPVGWENLEISASFGAISGQPSVDIDRFTFQNDAAKTLINYRKAGLTGGPGVFEGVPARMTLQDQGLNQVVFSGYLDLSDNYEEIEPQFKGGDDAVQVLCKFVDLNALNSFESVISGISFAYLEEQGVFTANDYINLPFIIEAGFNPLEIASTAISIYMLEQAIEDAIARVAAAITAVAGVAASSITAPLSAAIMAIALAAIEVILALALIVLIIELAIELVDLLLSPVRFHKCTPLSTLITKALAFYGYTVQTNLADWARIHYLPSRPAGDSTDLFRGIFPEPPVVKRGIPRTGDFGYLITEMLDIVRRLFGARIDIQGSKILIYNESDPVWKKKAAYTMADVLLPSQKFNTSDLRQTRIFNARTDPSDTWTVENYTGNAYEVKTEPLVAVNQKNVNIKGLDSIDFGIAWATRKDELNNLEAFLKIFTDIASDLMGVLKKGKKLKNLFSRRVGMMKVSSSAHTVPKLVLLEGGEIPQNYRDTLSAKAISETYYKHLSFVDAADNAQRYVYEDVQDMPFTIKDFQNTIKSSNFTTSAGEQGRLRSLRWKFAKDTATADFDVQKKYTNNLREVKIEESG